MLDDSCDCHMASEMYLARGCALECEACDAVRSTYVGAIALFVLYVAYHVLPPDLQAVCSCCASRRAVRRLVGPKHDTASGGGVASTHQHIILCFHGMQY